MKSECKKTTHGEHEWIKNGELDYCIQCYATRKHRKPELPKVKLVSIIES